MTKEYRRDADTRPEGKVMGVKYKIPGRNLVCHMVKAILCKIGALPDTLLMTMEWTRQNHL